MAEERPVDALLPIVYEELRRLAAAYLRRERPGQTLQPTALVHEAYLRLMKDRPDRWQNRAHFCAIAAHSMRQILIERARARGAQKRGGAQPRVTLDEGARRRRLAVDRSRRARRGARAARADRRRAGAARRAALLRRPHHRGDGRSDEHLPRHREAALDRRARVARARARGGPTGVTPERWRQVNELFHAALELQGAARQRLLDRTAATDAALADEVRSLLAVHTPPTSGSSRNRPGRSRPTLAFEASRRSLRAPTSVRTASSRKSAAAAWASSTPPKTRGSAARSRSRRCRPSTRATRCAGSG